MAHLLTHPLDEARSWLDLPNLFTFAKKDEGGSGSDDEDNDDDEDDDDEDDDDEKKDSSKKSGSKDDDDEDDDDEDDEEPLSDKAKAILRKNRKEARAAKARAKKAEADLARLQAKGGKSDDQDDAEKLAEAEARGAKKGEALAISASVRAALTTAGLSVGDDAPRAMKRAMRLIDLDDLSLNDDGSVDGLDDAIDDLKEEMPSLFRRPKKRRGNINGNDERGGKGPTRTPQTSAEKLAARLK